MKLQANCLKKLVKEEQNKTKGKFYKLISALKSLKNQPEKVTRNMIVKIQGLDHMTVVMGS